MQNSINQFYLWLLKDQVIKGDGDCSYISFIPQNKLICAESHTVTLGRCHIMGICHEK